MALVMSISFTEDAIALSLQSYELIIYPGAVSSCSEYKHEKCTLVVYSVSVVSLKMVEDVTTRRLRA